MSKLERRFIEGGHLPLPKSRWGYRKLTIDVFIPCDLDYDPHFWHTARPFVDEFVEEVSKESLGRKAGYINTNTDQVEWREAGSPGRLLCVIRQKHSRPGRGWKFHVRCWFWRRTLLGRYLLRRRYRNL